MRNQFTRNVFAIEAVNKRSNWLMILTVLGLGFLCICCPAFTQDDPCRTCIVLGSYVQPPQRAMYTQDLAMFVNSSCENSALNTERRVYVQYRTVTNLTPQEDPFCLCREFAAPLSPCGQYSVGNLVIDLSGIVPPCTRRLYRITLYEELVFKQITCADGRSFARSSVTRPIDFVLETEDDHLPFEQCCPIFQPIPVPTTN